MQNSGINRREFIRSLGGLTIAFSLSSVQIPTLRSAASKGFIRPDESQINAWIQVTGDGFVRVITGKMELGQGIKIAMRQVAAEELTIPVDRTIIQLAETGVTPDEGYTAGSRSIESSAMRVREAAACARERLMILAAAHWETDVDSLEMADGEIVYRTERLTIPQVLSGRQLTEVISEPREIYGKSRRHIVGQPVRRDDIMRMVRGEQVFIHDLRFDGMVHARIVRPPAYGASLESVDLSGLDPGAVIREGSFLAVVADDEWAVVKLQETIRRRANWRDGDPLPAGKPLKDYISELKTDSQRDELSGDPQTVISNAPIQFTATYFKPYIMHASNGPSCAVALYDNGNLSVWTHSQGVYPLRETIASLLDMSSENVHVTGMPGSGCYGHNGADDVAAEAAVIAMNYLGRHVRLQWMREEENCWEPYGTAMLMKLRAGLDASGRIQAWAYDLWSDGHSTRPRGNPGSLLPGRYFSSPAEAPQGGFRGGATRNAHPYYEIPSIELNSHIFSGPLRYSALRGLGAYANIFAIECFMDELAEKAGIDPIVFRLRHLADDRAKESLEKLRDMVSHVSPGPAQGIGIAFSRYKNSASYCAVAALVDGANRRIPRVLRMWAVVDAGETINPDGLKNQIEGGMIQSASWALLEEVKFNSQHVTSKDWNSYPVLRYQDVPTVEVEIIDHPDAPPLGAGEASQGPATAALVNAVYAATGNRVRDLPIVKSSE